MSKVINQPNGTPTAGRTSSVISIYDYPEHLNPFYEEDQHKRLRFWTIGKEKKKGRSNSFSLDSIKDWTFKSFRLKKRSSTLGINKTSESPPEMRRHPVPYSTGSNYPSNYNTYDSRARNTVAVGLNSTYPNTFDRGATYRSSLQDMKRNNPSNEFFIRNNRYRSTVQASNTSTPIMKHRNGIGSSQTSLNSTNPFDEDDTISLSSVNTLNRPSRKKRRAPPPPVAVPTIKTTAPSDEDTEKSLEIHNLTSEIESFVKNTNDDEYYTKQREKKIVVNTQTKVVHPSEAIAEPTINQSIREDVNDTTKTTDERQEIKITVIKPIEINENVNLKSNDKEKITPDKTIDIKQQQDNQSIDENLDDSRMNQKIEIEKKFIVPSTPETVYIKDANEIKEINITQETNSVRTVTEVDSTKGKVIVQEDNKIVITTTEPEVTPRKKKVKQPTDLTIEYESTIQTSKPLQTPLSRNCEDILESTTPNMKKQKFDLRISESVNSLDDKIINGTRNPTTPEIEPKTIKTENYEFKVRYLPLSDDNATKESRYDQWTRELRRHNSDDSLPGPSPSPRRRSVKDIIESINKNQRLLKVNQTAVPDEAKTKEEILAITESTDSLTRNLNHLLAEEQKISNFLSQMDRDDVPKENESLNPRGSYYDNIPVSVVHINTNELNNNMDLNDYKMRDKSKLDWNPVPKPRRSRHFSDDSNKMDVTNSIKDA